MWAICLEMAPFLLLGMAFSGIISIFIDNSIILNQIGQKNFSSVIKSTIMGIPLPLCSCGVIPVAATLKDSGASKGATTSFLVSTPQTGLDSIFLTYGMLGPVFAIFRPIAAFLSGLFCGLIVNIIDNEEHIHSDQKNNSQNNKDSIIERVKAGIEYGFITLPEDIVVPLFQGLLIAASIGFFVPPDFIASYVSSNTFLEYFIMLIVSLPLYVCATASIPIAVVLFSKGISAGAVFVFLMAGPATNASSIAVIRNIMGKKILYIYLILIASVAVFFGVTFDLLFEIDSSILSQSVHDHHHENIFYVITAILFLAIMINAYLMKLKGSGLKSEVSVLDNRDHVQSIDFIVNGMTCSHCKESVDSAIRSIDADLKASIDLITGKVVVAGPNLNETAIKEKIKSRGFTIQ